jgi:hypothetical protein
MNENTTFNNIVITAFGIMVMIGALCLISSLTSCSKIEEDDGCYLIVDTTRTDTSVIAKRVRRAINE